MDFIRLNLSVCVESAMPRDLRYTRIITYKIEKVNDLICNIENLPRYVAKNSAFRRKRSSYSSKYNFTSLGEAWRVITPFTMFLEILPAPQA